MLLPALNEQEGIGPTITEILEKIPNTPVLVIDGHSTDRTVEIARELGAHVIFQSGKGKGDALACGLRNLDPLVDYVVMTDADFTYSCVMLPEMIKTIEADPQVGMVCGNRFNDNLKKKTFPRAFYIGNRLIAFAHNGLNGVPLKDPLTGLRVIRASILRDWKIKSKGFDIEVELNHYIERKGFKTVEVDVEYRQRLGEKKLKVRHGAGIMKRIALEAFS